jgi:hypothetical protein
MGDRRATALLARKIAPVANASAIFLTCVCVCVCACMCMLTLTGCAVQRWAPLSLCTRTGARHAQIRITLTYTAHTTSPNRTWSYRRGTPPTHTRRPICSVTCMCMCMVLAPLLRPQRTYGQKDVHIFRCGVADIARVRVGRAVTGRGRRRGQRAGVVCRRALRHPRRTGHRRGCVCGYRRQGCRTWPGHRTVALAALVAVRVVDPFIRQGRRQLLGLQAGHRRHHRRSGGCRRVCQCDVGSSEGFLDVGAVRAGGRRTARSRAAMSRAVQPC